VVETLSSILITIIISLIVIGIFIVCAMIGEGSIQKGLDSFGETLEDSFKFIFKFLGKIFLILFWIAIIIAFLFLMRACVHFLIY
jgi:Mn2+/Fe2+ NRAMP family transporter